MNIFVGNLSLEVTENELRELFQAYGSTSTVTLVKDRDSGQPRGFAFVEMANDSEAKHAIKALNGTVLKEQVLTINEARPKHQALDGKVPTERRKGVRQELDTRSHRKHRY
jgi:RNA recognition motif-containing protein